MIRLYLPNITSLLIVLFCLSSFSYAESEDAPSDLQKLGRVNSIREGGHLQQGDTADSSLTNSAGKVSAPPPSIAEQDLTSTGLKMAQGLGLVLGILLIGAWAYKKYVLKDMPLSTRRMKVLERLMVAPRASLMLVEVENRKILVGTTGQNLSLLDVTSEKADFVHTLTEELK